MTNFDPRLLDELARAFAAAVVRELLEGLDDESDNESPEQTEEK